MEFKSCYCKNTKHKTMGQAKPKKISDKAPSGVPSIPSIRPTYQRNRPDRKGFNPRSTK